MVAGTFNAVVARGDRADEVTVTLESPTATVADLLAALGIDQPHLLIDDEHVVPGDHALVEVALRDGALLRGTSADGRRPPGRPTRTALEVVGGPESGNRADVPAGTYEIGRSSRASFQLASEAVSAVHAAIEVDDAGATTIDDRASFNGTWVNGVQVTSPTVLDPDDLVRIGNAELRVRPEPDDVPRLDRAGNVHAGTLPFNRPPRTALPDPIAPVTAPEAPRDGPRTSAFSIFAIIGPLLFAGVMVVVLGNIRFAIFAVLSPIMAVGTWFDSRRRSRKTSRKDANRYAEQVAVFETALDDAGAEERRRRELVWPHPAEVCRRAELPSTRLWERRAHADDFLVLRVASGSALWDPPFPVTRGMHSSPGPAPRSGRRSAPSPAGREPPRFDSVTISLAPEVADALAGGGPVVALESTIISHGLPRPDNLSVARQVEQVVRDAGAVPATIAVVGGEVRVGLDAAALETIATADGVAKTSVRDLAVVVARGAHGATTVAATAHLAWGAGIQVFATGGLGGVHRDAAVTFDESADLVTLARTGITIVCAGVKSILDVRATLERLETLGVTVVGMGTDRFPGFYLTDSGCAVDHRIDSVEEVAAMMAARSRLGTDGTALVVANPLPEDEQIDPVRHDRLLASGLAAAVEAGVQGKAVTPFLLERFHRESEGESVRANVAIILRNADLAARIAVASAR